ncbi:protein PSK SIMULATOR 2-like [Magnolia sinica]|uniref:protein PSK SIMULATOR 2-like n=1 Tax=Magnolia sinica TaxID=86752 RepID=UPI00265A2058|nr:protein PSK SIMULATOR 2-like [Magnolia sinica]
MGGICSRGIILERNPIIPTIASKDFQHPSPNLRTVQNINKKQLKDVHLPPDFVKSTHEFDSRELALSEPGESNGATPAQTGPSKAPEIGSRLGRAGVVGLERAMEVLDTLGSSMSNLHTSSGFVSGMATRGNKIFILAFEVANTIAKGANLLQSLSTENIQFLMKDILHSEGVQRLVSTDMDELLSIAAADKREELDVFSKEVVRFGDLCKDPQWHNLGRYFQKLDSDVSSHKQLKEEAEATMQQLIMLAQHTSELYHELNTLDRFDQDYRRKLQEEESLNVNHRGEGLMMLRSELKRQRKIVRSLRKKSLWSKNLEEVMEKLVDIVTFLHQEIAEIFGSKSTQRVMADSKPVDEGSVSCSQRLGVSGLSLHYANIINQIDSIVSRPSSIPPNTRDTLYHGLPSGVKAALRLRLQLHHVKEELAVPQIKAEMEKTLQWIVPIATNTTKAHQGFGWVGEWANTGNEFNKKTASQNNLIRLQTFYHADKEKMDEYILELVTWLHRLVSQVKYKDHGFKFQAPVRSPTRKGFSLSPGVQNNPSLVCNSRTDTAIQLSEEDKEMLKEVSYRKLVPGISKSQEFDTGKKRKGYKEWRLSRSIGNSPVKEFSLALDLECERIRVLDVMDGLDSVAVS